MSPETTTHQATVEFIRSLHPPDTLETRVPGEFLIACTGDRPTDYVENGRVMGIHGEVRRRVAEILGLEPRAVSMPFAEMIDALEAGLIDTPGIGTVWTPDRGQRFNVTQPFQYFFFGVASRDLPPIVELRDVASRRVAALDGSFNNPELSRATRAYGGSLTLRIDLDGVLDEIRGGLCDVAVYDYPNIERALAGSALSHYRMSRIRFEPQFPLNTGRMPLRLLFSAEAPSLCAAAMLALDLIRSSGELEPIYESYGCSASDLLDMAPILGE